MPSDGNLFGEELWPLIGLTPEHAQLAWERAAERAGNRKITRMVKSAANERHLAAEPAPLTHDHRQTKAALFPKPNSKAA